jgi:hypothetical protein
MTGKTSDNLKRHVNEADLEFLQKFGFKFTEIFVIQKRPPDCRVGESTRLPVDTIFFEPLNKSMVIVHNIPGLFFAKLVL